VRGECGECGCGCRATPIEIMGPTSSVERTVPRCTPHILRVLSPLHIRIVSRILYVYVGYVGYVGQRAMESTLK
jgi:hypothetical protein